MEPTGSNSEKERFEELFTIAFDSVDSIQRIAGVSSSPRLLSREASTDALTLCFNFNVSSACSLVLLSKNASFIGCFSPAGIPAFGAEQKSCIININNRSFHLQLISAVVDSICEEFFPMYFVFERGNDQSVHMFRELESLALKTGFLTPLSPSLSMKLFGFKGRVS